MVRRNKLSFVLNRTKKKKKDFRNPCVQIQILWKFVAMHQMGNTVLHKCQTQSFEIKTENYTCEQYCILFSHFSHAVASDKAVNSLNHNA